jgi:hypothetical protein
LYSIEACSTYRFERASGAHRGQPSGASMPDGRRPFEAHRSTASWKWSGAIQRREFVLRDPDRWNELNRCMPRRMPMEMAPTRDASDRA